MLDGSLSVSESGLFENFISSDGDSVSVGLEEFKENVFSILSVEVSLSSSDEDLGSSFSSFFVVSMKKKNFRQ